MLSRRHTSTMLRVCALAAVAALGAASDASAVDHPGHITVRLSATNSVSLPSLCCSSALRADG